MPRSQVLAILILIATVAAGAAEPIAPGAIDVIDGDTIRAHGRSVRLVGFDAPESGLRAQCESESTLAAKATFRLRQLVSTGGLDLESHSMLVPAWDGRDAPMQLWTRMRHTDRGWQERW
jgi:endonuclease YncB( thermonuclease family)